MTYYCKTTDGENFEPRLYTKSGDGRYPYVSTAPGHADGQSVVCTGYRWHERGVSATGTYEVFDEVVPEA